MKSEWPVWFLLGKLHDSVMGPELTPDIWELWKSIKSDPTYFVSYSLEPEDTLGYFFQEAAHSGDFAAMFIALQRFLNASRLAPLGLIDTPWPVYWLLDRLSFEENSVWVSVPTAKGSVGYEQRLLPIREKVSDFVRACKIPYFTLSLVEILRLFLAESDEVSVVEIGGNLGDFSLAASAMARAMEVKMQAVVFEPVREMSMRVIGSAADNKFNFTVVEKVVSTKAADCDSEISTPVGLSKIGEGIGSWAEHVTNPGEGQDTISVPTTALDCVEGDMSKRIMLKVSVLGDGVDVVFSGAKRFLNFTSILILMINRPYFTEASVEELENLLRSTLDIFSYKICLSSDSILCGCSLEDTLRFAVKYDSFELVAIRQQLYPDSVEVCSILRERYQGVDPIHDICVQASLENIFV